MSSSSVLFSIGTNSCMWNTRCKHYKKRNTHTHTHKSPDRMGAAGAGPKLEVHVSRNTDDRPGQLCQLPGQHGQGIEAATVSGYSERRGQARILVAARGPDSAAKEQRRNAPGRMGPLPRVRPARRRVYHSRCCCSNIRRSIPSVLAFFFKKKIFFLFTAQDPPSPRCSVPLRNAHAGPHRLPPLCCPPCVLHWQSLFLPHQVANIL